MAKTAKARMAKEDFMMSAMVQHNERIGFEQETRCRRGREGPS